MKISRKYIVMLAAAQLAACGDDGASVGRRIDDVGAGPRGAPSAGKACDALVNMMCSALVDCAAGTEAISSAERRQFEAACRDEFEAADFCTDVVAVSASYQDCVEDIEQHVCFDLEDLPSSCEGAVLS